MNRISHKSLSVIPEENESSMKHESRIGTTRDFTISDFNISGDSKLFVIQQSMEESFEITQVLREANV